MDAFEKEWAKYARKDDIGSGFTYDEVRRAALHFHRAGMRRAAAMAGTMAERPFDSEPEFSAVLAVEAAIIKEAGE